MAGSPPHGDELEAVLGHFNGEFRFRYRLPALTLEWLRHVDGLADTWTDRLDDARTNGVVDAGCAVLARIALPRAPRYAIGFLDGKDGAHVQFPDEGDDSSYRSHNVLMVNPLGGTDNWTQVSRWVRAQSKQQRRQELAGLASERRPNYAEIDDLLRTQDDDRAHVLPPDEAFSATRAAEVAFIYEEQVETLRAWKLRHRRERAAGKPGKPRNR